MGCEAPQPIITAFSLMPVPEIPFEVEDLEALRKGLQRAAVGMIYYENVRVANLYHATFESCLEFEKIHADNLKSAVFCDPNLRIESCPTNKPAKEGELTITNEQYFRAA